MTSMGRTKPIVDRSPAGLATTDPGQPEGDQLPACDRAPGDLDDQRDRDELRDRYYGLLQELRVLLPGVQIMVAFLLAVPFSGRFVELDSVGTALFAVALTSGLLAVVFFVGPTAYHRVGARTARSRRLIWSIRVTIIGLVFLAVSLLAALGVVTRFVYDGPVAAVITTMVGSTIVVLWVLLPLRAFTRR